MSNKVSCSSCGFGNILPTLSFCPVCGSRLVSPAPNPAANARSDGLDFLSPDQSNVPGEDAGWDPTPLKGFQTHGSIIFDGRAYSGDMKIVTSGLYLLGSKGTLKIPFSDMKSVQDITKSAFQIGTNSGSIIEVKLFNAFLWSAKIRDVLNLGW